MLVPILALTLSAAAEFAFPVADAKQPQLAAQGNSLALTYGLGDAVLFARSDDAGRTWSKPVTVWSGGHLALGMRRGPRVVFAKKSILVSATVDQDGKGGNLLAWRSTDGGATWSRATRINDVAISAREGLHAMAATGDVLFAAWLDDRSGAKELWGARSSDGGATWSANQRIYKAPAGPICQCCDPSVAMDSRGNVAIMFRNLIDGHRDMFVAQSSDGGKTFAPVRRLGEQSWKIDACPMDGGDLKLDAAGRPVAVWRRESDLYFSDDYTPEKHLAAGKNAALAVTPAGVWLVFQDRSGIRVLTPGRSQPRLLAPQGSFPSVTATSTGRVIAAWESDAGLRIESLTQ